MYRRRPKRWKRKILKRILREKRMCLIKKVKDKKTPILDRHKEYYI
jgi:hypothetical protein